ncbi:MAG TPA: flavodoxin family protein [Dissulfurispiraceae bacterium]|nr:flavodoxin family protein [Dissulfurispiraceae bacterium]
MKIVCLFGSPRINGNSAAIARRFLDIAEELGAEVETFLLNKLSYRGCQACYACKTKLDKCILDDDLSNVLEAVRSADMVVMSTPTYYGDVSGQLKCFIDRTFSYLKPNYLTEKEPSRLDPGKKLLFIITQGSPDENLFGHIFPLYDRFFKWYGFAESKLIRVCGAGGGGVVDVPEHAMVEAEQAARAFMA